MLYKSSLDYDWQTPKLSFELEDISLEEISEIMAVYVFVQLNKISEMSWVNTGWEDWAYWVLLKFINKFWLLVADKFWNLSEKLDSDSFIKWVIDYMQQDWSVSHKSSFIKELKKWLWIE